MTAGSGRKLCACLVKQNRIASFSRILLASETWGSTEYFLRWEGSATKCRCSIFRLVPWTRPSSDTDSGLSGLEPSKEDMDRRTQSAWDHAAKTGWPTLHGTAKEEYERRQGPTANELGNLCNKTTAAWPTPDASEAGKTSRSGDRKDEPLIGGIVRTSWPTPQARDEKGQTQNAERMDAVLNALKASWPTPRHADGGKSVRTPAGYEKEKIRMGKGCDLPTELNHLGETPYGCLAQTESFVVRLMTLSSWLMGYTGAYLRLWETASARRSQSRSSPRPEV